MKQGTILYDVDHFVKGSRVTKYTGFVYGCLAPGEVAVSEKSDDPPFVTVPEDAVEWDEE